MSSRKVIYNQPIKQTPETAVRREVEKTRTTPPLPQRERARGLGSRSSLSPTCGRNRYYILHCQGQGWIRSPHALSRLCATGCLDQRWAVRLQCTRHESPQCRQAAPVQHRRTRRAATGHSYHHAAAAAIWRSSGVARRPRCAMISLAWCPRHSHTKAPVWNLERRRPHARRAVRPP